MGVASGVALQFGSQGSYAAGATGRRYTASGAMVLRPVHPLVTTWDESSCPLRSIRSKRGVSEIDVRWGAPERTKRADGLVGTSSGGGVSAVGDC